MSAIELYEKLFYVFAGMGVLSLALSVFLFFRFEIPQTYAMLTGKARRKTIQEIENRNAQTGRLRQNPKTKDGKQKHPGPAQHQPVGKPVHSEKPENTGTKTPKNTSRRQRRPRPVIQWEPDARPETEVLSTPAMQTIILAKPTGITEELGPTEALKPAKNFDFFFQVTENTVSIHTDEII